MAQPTAKTAMARDPKNKPNQNQPGENGRKPGNRRASINRGPSTPEQREAQFRKKGAAGQTKELRTDVGALANNAMYNAQQFDPNRPFVGYEQPFSQEMNRARESVMGEFNRTMEPEFQRQDAEFNQRMLEQGIDPNSGAYQNQYRAMKESQNQARQSAMANAFQLGSSYQQQGFEQGVQAQMLPFQQYSTMENLWALPYRTEEEARQAEANRQAQIQAARLGGGSNVTAAQIQAAAQRDVAAMQQAQGWQGQPKPNPWANAAAGFAQGVGAGVSNYYLNRG